MMTVLSPSIFRVYAFVLTRVFPGFVTSTKKLRSLAEETSFNIRPGFVDGSGGVSVPSRVEANETELLPGAGWSETARTFVPLRREALGRLMNPEEIGAEISLRAVELWLIVPAGILIRRISEPLR